MLHVGVFFVWTLLLGVTEWLGPWRSAGALAAVGTVALVYAGIDEGLQAVPIIKRYARWDDFLANVGGVVLGVVVLGIAARWSGRRAREAAA